MSIIFDFVDILMKRVDAVDTSRIAVSLLKAAVQHLSSHNDPLERSATRGR